MGMNRLFSIIVVLILLACFTGAQGTSANLLRLEGPEGWTKHIEVTQGTTASLVVLAEKEGIGYLNELSPDGRMHSYSYFFRRYDHLPFHAIEPGRYVLSYIIDGKESNPVQIDVAMAKMDHPTHYAAPQKGANLPPEDFTYYIAPAPLGGRFM